MLLTASEKAPQQHSAGSGVPHLRYECADDCVFQQHLVPQQADGIQQVLLLRLELTVQVLNFTIHHLFTSSAQQAVCSLAVLR